MGMRLRYRAEKYVNLTRSCVRYQGNRHTMMRAYQKNTGTGLQGLPLVKLRAVGAIKRKMLVMMVVNTEF